MMFQILVVSYLMIQAKTIAELRSAVAALRSAGRTVGFVPTMGALHEGHLSLVRSSNQDNHATVVSIFVNPTQFGPNEDFSKYPRTLENDLAMLEAEHTEIVFTPSASEVYPSAEATLIDVGNMTKVFEGAIRPGHFAGVATVVTGLFMMVMPDVAYFGQKDLQQCAVIRKLIRDLHIPVRLVIAPTIRESDGLAMSSRNRYLSDEERTEAAILSRMLRIMEDDIAHHFSPEDVMMGSKIFFGFNHKKATLDYAAIVDPETFQIVDSFKEGKEVGVIAAMRLGSTRLIDNVLVTP